MRTFESECSSSADDLADLRKQLRQRRRALSHREQKLAATAICERILKLRQVQQAKRIAVYLPFDGEVATQLLCQRLWRSKKDLYLPYISQIYHGQMLFLPYAPETILQANQFGIQEPLPCQATLDLIQAIELDIILLPLVAFDRQRYRLGMGGGYYDRILLNYHKTGAQTLGLGLAHDCQEVEELPRKNWERPLSMVITPRREWSE